MLLKADFGLSRKTIGIGIERLEKTLNLKTRAIVPRLGYTWLEVLHFCPSLPALPQTAVCLPRKTAKELWRMPKFRHRECISLWGDHNNRGDQAPG